MLKEENIMYEIESHWVLKVKTGFEVYRNEITHSVRRAQIGFTGNKGLNRAITECNKRSATAA